MDNPKCRLCGERHSIRDPHVFKPNATVAAHPVTIQLHARSKPVTPVTGVTQEAQSVTPLVTDVTGSVTKHCPTCTCVRVHASPAAKQRAYRQRKVDAELRAAGLVRVVKI